MGAELSDEGDDRQKRGETYYLYKRTSRRVPGKKYPQPVDTYVGVITPAGVIESAKKKVNLTGAVVREYGFSRALEVLCPQGWKDPLGENWKSVLDYVIMRESPESYVSEEREVPEELEPGVQYGAQKASLVRRIYKEWGVELDELRKLMTIYLIYLDGKKIISRISEEQAELLERLGISMEVD